MNRLLRTFTYDGFYRLKSANSRESNSPASLLSWEERVFSHDHTRTHAYTERYTYDRAGNILAMAHANRATRVYSVEDLSNRQSKMKVGVIEYDYAYDANGNMTSETSSRRFS